MKYYNFVCIILIYINRFREGLSTMGILEAMRKHPDSFQSAFRSMPIILTADILAGVFAIQRSDAGSNKWEKEGQILALWMDYVQDSEGIARIKTHRFIVIMLLHKYIFYVLRTKLCCRALQYSILCNWMFIYPTFRVPP